MTAPLAVGTGELPGTLARSTLERFRLVDKHLVNAYVENVADRREQPHVETFDVPVLTAEPVGRLLRDAELLNGHRQVVTGHSACGEKVVDRNMHGAESNDAVRLALVTECEVYSAMRINSEGSYHWERILAAFDYSCAYCGANDVTLCKEHMMPTSRGGGDEIENIVPSCRPCNSSKRDLTPLEWFLVEEGVLRRAGVTYESLVMADSSPAFKERWARVYNDTVTVFGETEHSYRCRWNAGYNRCVRKDMVHLLDDSEVGDWIWLSSPNGAR